MMASPSGDTHFTQGKTRRLLSGEPEAARAAYAGPMR